MKKASYKFLFNRLDRLREDGTAPIHLEICLGTSQRYINTGFKVRTEDWNTSHDKKGGDFIKSSHSNYYHINFNLRAMLQKVEGYEIDQLNKGKRVTIDQLANFMRDKQDMTFLDFFEYHFIGQSKGRTGSTVKQYYSTLNHIKRFGGLRDFGDLTYPNIQLFDDYLRSKGLATETIYNIHKRLKTSVREALKHDYIEKSPYILFKAEKSKQRTIRYLTPDELTRIEEKKFSSDRLNQIRDVFLFSCYTGLGYSDVEKLIPDNVTRDKDGTKWLKIDRKKTGILSLVYLLPPALDLIKKYKGGEKLLPVKSNQRMNEYLKEIQTLCKIKTKLSTHVARHTCATMLLNKKIPLEIVAKVLGHTDIRTTAIYAKILDETVKDEMKKIKDQF
jgi:site-specific recombinase XerD